MNIPVSMVTAADTIFRYFFFFFFFREFPCRIIEVPDNRGPDNRGSTVLHAELTEDVYLVHTVHVST